MSKRLNTSEYGQTVAEYGLIAALVGAASIAGLVALGGNMQGALNGMLAERPKASQAMIANLPSNSAAAAAINFGVQTSLKTSSSTSSSGTLSTLGLTGQAAVTKQLVETAGANGATVALANRINSVAKQLLDSGKINQEQANSLASLANQAYRMANVEKALEEAMTSGTALSQPLQANGQTFSKMGQLLDTIGYGSGNVVLPGSESEKLQNIYNQIAASGALKDPQVQSLVSSLTQQINDLSNVVQTAGWAVSHGQLDQSGFEASVASKYPSVDQTASNTTNKNATTICSAGGDNGNQNNNCN